MLGGGRRLYWKQTVLEDVVKSLFDSCLGKEREGVPLSKDSVLCLVQGCFF